VGVGWALHPTPPPCVERVLPRSSWCWGILPQGIVPVTAACNGRPLPVTAACDGQQLPVTAAFISKQKGPLFIYFFCNTGLFRRLKLEMEYIITK
jgi:hypothetical protein